MVRKRAFQKFILFSFLALFFFNSSSPAEPASFNAQSTLLATLPPGTSVGEVKISPNGQKASFRWKQGLQERYVINGVEQALYDQVERILFSDDGEIFAYPARKGKKWLVVSNGREGKEYEFVFDLHLSPDGKNLAYQAVAGSKQWIVLNDKEVGSFDRPPRSSYGSGIVLSPLGDRLAYKANRGKQSFYVLDAKEGAPFDSVDHGVFSPDGKTFGYEGRRGLKFFVVINEKEEVLVYKAKENGQWFIVNNGVEGKRYKEVGSIAISADGQEIVSSASEDGKNWFIIRNGREEKQKMIPWEPRVYLSPDGKKFAYTAKGGMVIQGIQGKNFEEIYSDQWSQDGANFVYVIFREGKMYLVLNGKESQPYEHILPFPFRRSIFSPDRKYLGFNAVKGNQVWWAVQAVP